MDQSAKFSLSSRLRCASSWRAELPQALLIVLAGALLLVGCFGASFTTYDDPMHVSDNETITAPGPVSLLHPEEGRTYFPLTLVSYRLDHYLFAEVLHLENWAPGVRAMSCLYHVLAALLLWRLMLWLGLSRWQALFVALAFVAHPLACETVCWTSERKNALAGLFAFAALYAWCRFEDRWWRVPLAALLYILACMGKPSALGLLPVIAVLEVFGGRRRLLMQHAPARSGADWAWSLARLLPPALVSWFVLRVNLAGHSGTIVPPPGGSVYTAALTDLEILCRYLWNLLAPVNVSAVYLVEPVVSLADPRVTLFAGTLIALLAGSLTFAENRKRACFAWLWFFGALGTNLNFIAIPHYMQDRFLYLSTPAFFMLLCEVSEGLAGRVGLSLRGALRGAGAALLLALAALAVSRSFVFQTSETIFGDAVAKQPRAAFARWGLGMAYLEQAQDLHSGGRRSRVEDLSARAMRQWKIGVDNCPDATRYTIYSVMANAVGEERNAHNYPAEAERYWSLAAHPPGEAVVEQDARAKAMGHLSNMRFAQGNPRDAHAFAQAALSIVDDAWLRFLRARAALALSATLTRQNTGEREVARLEAEARTDIELIPAGSKLHAEALELLQKNR